MFTSDSLIDSLCYSEYVVFIVLTREILLFLQLACTSEDVIDESRMMSMDQWEFLSPFSDDPSFNSSHLLDTWRHPVELRVFFSFSFFSSSFSPSFQRVLVLLYLLLNKCYGCSVFVDVCIYVFYIYTLVYVQKVFICFRSIEYICLDNFSQNITYAACIFSCTGVQHMINYSSINMVYF